MYLETTAFKDEFSHTILHDVHPFSALGVPTGQESEPHEENKQDMDLFHPPAAYLSEGGQEADYR